MQSLCSRAIVLDKGKIVFNGNTQEAINHYQNRNELNKNNDLSWQHDDAPGGDKLKILGIKISAKNGAMISISSGITLNLLVARY